MMLILAEQYFLNNELVKYTIRLKGVDSPEIRPPSKDKYSITKYLQQNNQEID